MAKARESYVKDYCVYDIETTGRSSYDSIIEIGALKVHDGKVVDEFDVLINPHRHIPGNITLINNITDDLVKDAPDISEAMPKFLAFVGNDVVIGYNNASFDGPFIRRSCEPIGLAFENDYIDVITLVRRKLLGEIEKQSLACVCEHFGIATVGAHRSVQDCYMTKSCYDALYESFGNTLFRQPSRRQPVYSEETKLLWELEKIVSAIPTDEPITMIELADLQSWIDDHQDLEKRYPFSRVFKQIQQITEDGYVSPEKHEQLKKLFAELIDPVEALCYKGEIGSIKGKHFVVTGDFNFGERDEVIKYIESYGAISDKAVTKTATNFVIVGANGSQAWKSGSYGGKIDKARKFISDGADIKIVKEDDFFTAIETALEEDAPEEPEVTADIPDQSKDQDEPEWKTSIKKMLADLIEKYELPAGSLYLSDNYGQVERTKNTIVSYSVCIWEPDYPSSRYEKPGQNVLVATLAPTTVRKRIGNFDTSFSKSIADHLQDYLPLDAEVFPQNNSDLKTNTIRMSIPMDSPQLTDYIKRHTVYALDHYVSKAGRFGCCSHYNECSDAKKCVHPNKLYSRACFYREHLEKGEIFYGKNRNVDKEDSEPTITQEVRLGDDIIILDNATWYSGAEKLEDRNEKLVRKALSLPITKQLVYYPSTYKNITKKVTRYKLVEFYEITDRWYMILIELEDGSSLKIHSMFLSEMQKPDFLKEVNQQSGSE